MSCRQGHIQPRIPLEIVHQIIASERLVIGFDLIDLRFRLALERLFDPGLRSYSARRSSTQLVRFVELTSRLDALKRLVM